MRYSNVIWGMSLALASGLVAGSAAADIPPPGVCDTEEAGQSCDEPVDEAGESVDGPGVCVAEQCRRTTPDGPMTYDCVMCRSAGDEPVPSEGGAGGTGGEPSEPSAGTGGSSNPSQAGSAGKATSPNPSRDDDDDGGGCSVGHSRGTGTPLAAAALALIGFAVRRRRSSSARV